MEKTGDFSFLIIFCLKRVDENQAKKTLMMNDSKFTEEKRPCCHYNLRLGTKGLSSFT